MTSRNLQTLFFIMVGCTITALCLGSVKCPDGYIGRGRSEDRRCCRKVTENCKAGEYVEICKSDLGEDTCQPCSGDTWMADETNSDLVFLCVPYDGCSYGAKRVNYLPLSGCHEPCICDTELNFFGFDSCNCKLFDGYCPVGTKLALNGTCLHYIIADKMNDLRPTMEAVFIPVKKEGLVQKENKTEHFIIKTDLWMDFGRWLVTAVAAVVSIILLVIATKVCLPKCSKKRCKQGYNDPENHETIIKQAATILSESDSGVSLTSRPSCHGEPGTREPSITADDTLLQLNPINIGKQIAAVAPYKVVNQTEITPLMRTHFDRELVQDDSPPYQFPEISLRRPVDMDTEGQEDTQSELVNVQHDFGSGLSSIST